MIRHTAAMQPDVLHLHSLLYVCVLLFAQRRTPGDRRESVWTCVYPSGERRRPMRGANARVAPLLWLHGCVCLAGALYFHAATGALISVICLYGGLYFLCYRSAVRLSGSGSDLQMNNESSRAAKAVALGPSRAMEPPGATELPRAAERSTAQMGASL
jgi:hypothetical protein